MSSLERSTTVTISREELQKLYERFAAENGLNRYYVQHKSGGFILVIEELWFQTKGYDYWYNPYPNVIESVLNTDGSYTITYEKNYE